MSLFNSVIYSTSPDNKYRYSLGTKGDKTLFCFGINPSTATPEKYDPTIKRVEKVAIKEGFDSFVMFNIYPLRATNPDDLPNDIELDEHKRNLETILSLLKDDSVIWAAWGDLIKKRNWLVTCWHDILSQIMLNKRNVVWVKMGDLTNKGNPRHPLYLKYQPLSSFYKYVYDSKLLPIKKGVI